MGCGASSAKVAQEDAPPMRAAQSGDAEDTPQCDVMISYSHADATFTRRLVASMRDAGLSVWIDEEELQGGTPSIEAIGKAICQCRCMVPVLSTSRPDSKWCTDELGLGYSNRKTLFPVSIDSFDAIHAKLGYSDKLILNGVQWENASGSDEGERVQALISRIKKALKYGIQSERAGSRRDSEDARLAPFWPHYFGDETFVTEEAFIRELTKEINDQGGLLGVNASNTDLVVELVQKELVHEGKVQRDHYDAFGEAARQRLQGKRVDAPNRAWFLEAVSEFVHTEITISYLVTINIDEDTTDDVIDALSKLSTLPLESRRQFQLLQPQLLACLRRALGRVGNRRPTWVQASAAELHPLLINLLDDKDRIVRACAALCCGMLKIEAAGDKLAYLWRNDPISTVRESALDAMKAVGGEKIEQKLRIEKVLSRYLQDFRIELEKKSYQKELPKPLMKEITESKLQAAARLGEQPDQKQAAGAAGSKSPAKLPGNSPAKLSA